MTDDNLARTVAEVAEAYSILSDNPDMKLSGYLSRVSTRHVVTGEIR